MNYLQAVKKEGLKALTVTAAFQVKSKDSFANRHTRPLVTKGF